MGLQHELGVWGDGHQLRIGMKSRRTWRGIGGEEQETIALDERGMKNRGTTVLDR